MNRMMFALAVVAGMTVVGSARADWGTPPAGPPEGYAQPGPTESTAGRYGIHPMFKKLLFWKKDTCDTCDTARGCKGGKCKGTAAVPPPYGVYGSGQPMPGTLVFPNHPYNRSPRDFFMSGPGN